MTIDANSSAPAQMVAADATLDDVRVAFENDRFATLSLAPTIEEARAGYARVSMTIESRHLNGMGSLMGGVPYTLADYTFAIASNIGQPPTVSVSNTIDYLSVPKDDCLVAVCEVEKSGRSLCFARVNVTDGTGRAVARVNVTGFRKG